MSLLENYGGDALNWGTYPIDLSLDSGGGCSTCKPQLPSADEMKRVACNMKRTVERGGNNPYEFEACPKNDTVYGTGCMNSGCMCKDCQGDCVCSRAGGPPSREGFSDYFMKQNLSFWIVTGLAAYLVYYFLKHRPMRGKK